MEEGKGEVLTLDFSGSGAGGFRPGALPYVEIHHRGRGEINRRGIDGKIQKGTRRFRTGGEIRRSRWSTSPGGGGALEGVSACFNWRRLCLKNTLTLQRKRRKRRGRGTRAVRLPWCSGSGANQGISWGER